MRYLSVCSGIEAASSAWHPLGWSPVAFAEIEAFPCAVLKHHYPNVPNWGDITKFKEWPDATVDVLVGGTPCQSFSVAGLRAGLADPRGNLALTFLAIADKYRPAWILWENVPGVLSSDGGRDFGAFLGGLGQLGYGWSYRVLDAQYVRTHGHPRAVPQRRRRVFVVGHLGDWRRAAAVLFESESMSGHSAPRRQAGERTSGPIAGCSNGGGANGPGRTADDADSLIPTVADPISANEAKTYCHGGYNNGMKLHNVITQAVAHSLTTMGRGGDVTEDGTGRGCPIVPVAHALRADGFDASEAGTYTHEGKNNFRLHNVVATDLRNGAVDDVTMSLQGGGQGDERGRCINAIPHVITQAVANPLTHRMHKGINTTMDEGQTMVAHALRADGFDASEDGTGRGTPLIAFDTTQITSKLNRSVPKAGDPCHPLAAGAHPPAVAFQPRYARNGRGAPDEIASALTGEAGRTGKGDSAQCVAFATSSLDSPRDDGSTPPVKANLNGQGTGSGPSVFAAISERSGWAVRRLTPRECERLQGFPDGYTQVPYRGKPAADGPRYKALGNSFAVNVVSWIGQRIQMVDDIDKENPDDQVR